ncbi:hypothetical protein PG997_009105 [Apiospora hydei]|uniref:Uncharacterized protein n=1 Tax=Apiospora hydei TaxID=1337664 RepID=A0ABR1VTF9_9PEZI
MKAGCLESRGGLPLDNSAIYKYMVGVISDYRYDPSQPNTHSPRPPNTPIDAIRRIPPNMKLMLNMIALLATATAAVPANALSARDDYWFTAGRYCTLPDMEGDCHLLKDHTGNPYSCSSLVPTAFTHQIRSIPIIETPTRIPANMKVGILVAPLLAAVAAAVPANIDSGFSGSEMVQYCSAINMGGACTTLNESVMGNCGKYTAKHHD